MPADSARPRYCRVVSIVAIISALFEQQMNQSSALGRTCLPKSGMALLLVGVVGSVLGGCMQATLSPTSNANLSSRDRQLLARAPYAQASIPETFPPPYCRLHAQGAAGDDPGRYQCTLSVLRDAGRKAVRYGVTVGEEAQAWSGVATIGKTAEWPDWIPTEEIQQRLGPYPKRVAGGPANPLGARAIYLYQGGKDTLTASTAPISRNISAMPSRPAASA